MRNEKKKKGESVQNENSKEFESWENNEEDLTPKVYQSLKAQILCDTQGEIQSLLSQINIIPIPKPTSQANDKPYMISFQIFSH